MTYKVAFQVKPERLEGVLRMLSQAEVSLVTVKLVQQDPEPTVTVTREKSEHWTAPVIEKWGEEDRQKWREERSETNTEIKREIAERLVEGTLPVPPKSVMYKPGNGARGKDNEPRIYVGGKRDKGITGRELVLEIFRTLPYGKVLSISEITEEFVKHDFSTSSPSAPLHALVAEGVLIRPAFGQYFMPHPLEVQVK